MIAITGAAGVTVRRLDYDDPQSLDQALEGAKKLLLISSNELGRRVNQHAAVIAAARRARVELIAYTSVLHADVSSLELAADHRATEAALHQSGIAHVLLRNGWYNENHAAGIAAALKYGVLLGSAGAGRISSASREDFAAAAAAVLTQDKQAGRVYELAGDTAYTMADLAGEISRGARKTIAYQDMPAPAFRAALIEGGLPEPIASLLADADAYAANGALFDDSRTLSSLLGRPTTPMAATVAGHFTG